MSSADEMLLAIRIRVDEIIAAATRDGAIDEARRTERALWGELLLVLSERLRTGALAPEEAAQLASAAVASALATGGLP